MTEAAPSRRSPLTCGFLILAASGVALGIGVGGHSAYTLIPGLVLQGLALGIVLTVDDPVGMNAVDEEDQGEAAGIINIAEQLGGALGIAILGAVQLTSISASWTASSPTRTSPRVPTTSPRPSSSSPRRWNEASATFPRLTRGSPPSTRTSSTPTVSRSGSRSSPPPSSRSSVRWPPGSSFARCPA